MRKSLTRAQRDNDLIYHQDVPATSALPAIQQTNLATTTTPAGLLNPASILGSKRPIFGELIGWGAKEAISKRAIFLSLYLFIRSTSPDIYNDRKHAFVKERVVDVAQELQDEADEYAVSLIFKSNRCSLSAPC